LSKVAKAVRGAIMQDSNFGTLMPTLLVRDLDAELVQLLKQRAASHQRSAQAEHRSILEAVLRPKGESFAVRARRLADETRGRRSIDSADLIRADRDRDHAA
jgi:plasmid stability protein